MIKTITLTHAVLDRPFELVVTQLFGMYYSEQTKATILLSSGATTVPVKESVESIKFMLAN